MPTLNLAPAFIFQMTSEQVKSSRAPLNCGKAGAQNLDNSGGTQSTPSLSSQPYTYREMVLSTDDQIQDLIAKQVAYFRTILTQKNRNYGHTYSNKGQNVCTNGWDSTLQSNDVSHLPATSASEDVGRQSLNCAVIEQCTAAVGQSLEEDRSNGSKANADLTPKSKETGDCATSASEKHSTEYPQTMGKVAASCTKNEDEGPVVLTAVSRMTWDELTEKYPSSTLNCNTSQEEYKSHWINNKDLDWTLKHMTEREKGDAGLKPVEAVGLDNVQGVTDVSEDLQTKSSSVASENRTLELISLTENQDANTKKVEHVDRQHCSVTCKEAIAHSMLNSSIGKTSHEGAMEDVVSVHSQTDVSITLSKNKVKEEAPLSENGGQQALSVKNLKDLRYEDMSQLATELVNTGHEKFPVCFEALQYEDISEDESPRIENMEYVEKPLLTQMPEPSNKQVPFEYDSYGRVQGQNQMKTEIISDKELIPKKHVSPEIERLDIAQRCSYPCFLETGDGFEGLCPKYDSKRHPEWQTSHFVFCSPSSVLNVEDDQMDDDWIVVPLSMSDLKFEPEEDHDSLENVVLDDGGTGDKETQSNSPTHSELQWLSPKPVPASPTSQIEVFDTIESFLRAKSVQLKNRFEVASGSSTPEYELECEGELHIPQNKRESYSEDSSETEDSCDYSPGSERNYLTVSRQLLKKRSEAVDSTSEKDSEDEVTNVKKVQTRSLQRLGCMQKHRQLIEAKAGSNHVRHKTTRQKILKKDDIIILDSDTGDESDQNCKKKAKRKRLMPSASQQQLKPHDTQFKEVMQDTSSDLSHCTEKSGHLTEPKAGSEHVQHNGQKISSVIVIDSDNDDQNYQKANRKRFFPSGSLEGSDAPCVQLKRHSPETVDSQYGTAKEKLRETILSSGDPSLPQDQSKLHSTQFNEAMQNTSADLSHSTEKSRHLTKAKGGSEHVQHKINRQRMSKERRTTKRILSSGSAESGNALFATKNRASTETVDCLCETDNRKPEKRRLSTEDSPKKQPQSVDEVVDSTLGSNPVSLMSSHSVQMHGNDEALPPKTSKKTDFCEKIAPHLYRNKTGRFVSKQKPANDRHHATKNMVQANVAKPRLGSRQLSLPSQEGPSTSSSSLPSTSGQLSEARRSSTSSATMHLPAVKQVIKDWQNSFVPTRRDRKSNPGMEENLRTTKYDSYRGARPGRSNYDKAPRHRHSFHKSSTTPLMKKTKSDAILWTKAINRDAQRKQRCSVGEGYKWTEKPVVAKPTKGSGR